MNIFGNKIKNKPALSYWVKFDFDNPETYPPKYDKYLVHRKDEKIHWETWNNSYWAYNGNVITHWAVIIKP